MRSYCWFVPVVYLYTFVLGTLSLLSSLFDHGGRVQQWFARTWARLILKTVGIKVHVEGLEHLHASQAAIYAANHLSAVDIPVLYACLPVQFRIMAKRELFRYPFIGWYLKRSGQIPIVYGDPHSSLRSLNRAGDALRTSGFLLLSGHHVHTLRRVTQRVRALVDRVPLCTFGATR